MSYINRSHLLNIRCLKGSLPISNGGTQRHRMCTTHHTSIRIVYSERFAAALTPISHDFLHKIHKTRKTIFKSYTISCNSPHGNMFMYQMKCMKAYLLKEELKKWIHIVVCTLYTVLSIRVHTTTHAPMHSEWWWGKNNHVIIHIYHVRCTRKCMAVPSQMFHSSAQMHQWRNTAMIVTINRRK